MNAMIAAIRAELENRPGHMYVASNGEALYVLTPDDQVLVMLGHDLHLMNEEQINKFFQDTLKKLV